MNRLEETKLIHDDLVSTGVMASYMIEMGVHSLLDYDEETRITKRINDGLESIRTTISNLELSPASEKLKKLLAVFERKAAVNGTALPYDRLIKAVKIALKNRSESKEHSLVAFLLEDDVEVVEKYKELLVKANLRLVIKIAHNYRTNVSISRLDLIQDGNAGLIRAIYRFDPAHGNRFATYASWWIRQAMQRAVFQNGRTIRWPAHIFEIIQSIARYKRENNCSHMTDKEIAVSLGYNQEVIHAITLSKDIPYSLDCPLSGPGGDNDDHDYKSMIPDEEHLGPYERVAGEELSKIVLELFGRLKPREARIMRLRFGIDCKREHTLQEIADKEGLSRERVRQIQIVVQQKLAKHCKSRQLGDYIND